MLAGKSLPPLVTQIADGENGGVLMNDFPPKHQQVMAEASGGDTPATNVTEYLEYLEQLGLQEEDLPAIQPIQQKRIWDRFEDGAGPEAMAQTIEQLKREDAGFHMDGGSWTNNLSWGRGYEQLLGPMERASAQFAERILARGVPASDAHYRQALFQLLTSQTSCLRYWGEGTWTDYGQELCRRLGCILNEEA